MFAVIYHWRLKDGASEAEFRKFWHEGTIKIYKERGSLGSSLHKLSDGTFLAYARWPNKADWQKMMNETSKTSGNKQYVESVEEPLELELLDDLLQTKQYSK
jgi:hypothetical protein